MDAISFADFEKVDVRVGRIVQAEAFPEARKPAYKLTIDFGPEIGTRRSSAQLTHRYTREELEGRLLLGVINLGGQSIGPCVWEGRTLGVPGESGGVVLVVRQADVPL